jgi:hypothetical protein
MEIKELLAKIKLSKDETAKLEKELSERQGKCIHVRGEVQTGFVYCKNCNIAMAMA